MKLSVARLIVQFLREAGARYVFGLSGHSIFPLTDALYSAPEIRLYRRCTSFPPHTWPPPLPRAPEPLACARPRRARSLPIFLPGSLTHTKNLFLSLSLPRTCRATGREEGSPRGTRYLKGRCSRRSPNLVLPSRAQS